MDPEISFFRQSAVLAKIRRHGVALPGMCYPLTLKWLQLVRADQLNRHSVSSGEHRMAALSERETLSHLTVAQRFINERQMRTLRKYVGEKERLVFECIGAKYPSIAAEFDHIHKTRMQVDALNQCALDRWDKTHEKAEISFGWRRRPNSQRESSWGVIASSMAPGGYCVITLTQFASKHAIGAALDVDGRHFYLFDSNLGEYVLTSAQARQWFEETRRRYDASPTVTLLDVVPNERLID